MSTNWWLHGKLRRRSRAEWWADGISVRTDDTGATWEVPPRTEFAESGSARWEEAGRGAQVRPVMTVNVT